MPRIFLIGISTVSTRFSHQLLGYWRALQRITVCPQRIGTIVAAALVPTSMQRGRR